MSNTYIVSLGLHNLKRNPLPTPSKLESVCLNIRTSSGSKSLK